MFSARLHWDLTPNPIAALREQKRAAGTRVWDLTESNPTAAGLRYPEELIRNALAQPEVLRYEPLAAGLPAAREAVGRTLGVDPARVLLTASTSEAYGFLFKLLTNPGDEVLVPQPSYPLFEFLAQLELVTVRHYPLAYHDGWFVDLPELLNRVTERTRAVVVVNPNNPTGSYLKQHELASLVQLCAAKGLALISDEVFQTYTLRPDPARASTVAGVQECLAFAMGGLSKEAALPQLKAAWVIAAGPEALVQEAMERLELIADTYLSVGTPVQWALPHLLEARQQMSGQILARALKNLAVLRQALSGDRRASLLDVEGGWYVVLQVPRTQSEQEWVLELLREEDVLVQPGYFYDFPREAFLVLSLLTPPAVWAEGVTRLLRRVG